MRCASSQMIKIEFIGRSSFQITARQLKTASIDWYVEKTKDICAGVLVFRGHRFHGLKLPDNLHRAKRRWREMRPIVIREVCFVVVALSVLFADVLLVQANGRL